MDYTFEGHVLFHVVRFLLAMMPARRLIRGLGIYYRGSLKPVFLLRLAAKTALER